jgi:hypothetical protein
LQHFSDGPSKNEKQDPVAPVADKLRDALKATSAAKTDGHDGIVNHVPENID